MKTKMKLIKIIHTLIWVFYNFVIFYMLHVVIIGKLDNWLLIEYVLIILSGISLLIFKFFCPLTIIARKYSDSPKENFDIYLPNWLAKYNKRIYSGIMIVIVILTVYQVMNRSLK